MSDKVRCTFHIPLGEMYLISNYETGQYGHEPFDFIILRNEEQDILQIGKTIAEPETSKIYLQANKNITGIINTDSASMNLTIMPEFPCSGLNNPCINANCTRTIEQHRFDCICIIGHGRSNGTRYKCEGKLTIKIVLLQFKLRILIKISTYFCAFLTVLFLCSIYFTQILTNASHNPMTATKMQNAPTLLDHFLANATLGTLKTA